MANFVGLSLPAYGAGAHYDTSQTENWTLQNDGRLLISIASTRPGETTGIEIALALSSTTPTTAYNLLLSRSSTKAATTDGLLGLELAADAVGVSAIELAMGAGATLTNFLSVNGTKGPTNFLYVGPSSGGAAQAVGFFTPAGTSRYLAAPTTTSATGWLKVVGGTYVYYVPCVPNTNIG